MGASGHRARIEWPKVTLGTCGAVPMPHPHRTPGSHNITVPPSPFLFTPLLCPPPVFWYFLPLPASSGLLSTMKASARL